MQRYEEYTDKIVASQEKRRYATLYYPRIEQKPSDVYFITNKMDRLDLIANKYYGDPRLWVVLARANVLHLGTLRVDPGIRLRVPYPLDYGEVEEIFTNAQF